MCRYPLPIFCIVLLFCGCKKTQPLSSEKNITAFVFKAADNSLDSDINGTIKNDSIYVKLPAKADIHHLVSAITFSGKSLNPQDKILQDFSAAVHYTVTAEDGSTKMYTAVVTYRSSAKEITAFTFKSGDNAGITADIDAVIAGDTITAIVPVAADITRLVPTITHTGVSVKPESKAAGNFSIPVTYTVTAEDGSTRNYIMLVSSNATVFVAAGNFVYALNAANGTAQWKYDLGYAASTVTYHDGVVFSGGYQNYLYAINASTGKLKWKSANRKGVYSMCAFDNGLVFYGLNYSLSNMYMCAVDEATGAFKWEYKFLPCGYCYLHNPVAVNGIVHIPDFGGGMFAFDESTGSLRWRNNTFGISDGNPVVVNGSLYFAAEGCLLGSLNASTGTTNWLVRGGGSSAGSPLLQNGIVYNSGYQNNNSRMYAVDTATRSVQWITDASINGLSAGGYFSSAAVDEHRVYANNQNGGLYALNIDDGSVIFGPTIFGQQITPSTPVLAHGTLYTCRGNNNFYAIDAATGTVKWIFYGTSLLNTSAVVLDVDGNVFAAADFGEQN